MNPRTAAKTVLLLAFAPALVLSLSACGIEASASTGQPAVEGTKLAGDVEKQLVDSNEGVTVADTECEDTTAIVVDRTTSCTATVNGEPMKLLVTWANSEGDYSVSTVPS